VLVPGRARGIAPTRSASPPRSVPAARGATRETAMSSPARPSPAGRRSILDKRSAPAEHPVLRYPTRAYQPDRASPTTRSPPAPETKHEAPAPDDQDGRLALPLDRKPLHISCTAPRGRRRRADNAASSRIIAAVLRNVCEVIHPSASAPVAAPGRHWPGSTNRRARRRDPDADPSRQLAVAP
jgi:hypothetical protein